MPMQDLSMSLLASRTTAVIRTVTRMIVMRITQWLETNTANPTIPYKTMAQMIKDTGVDLSFSDVGVRSYVFSIKKITAFPSKISKFMSFVLSQRRRS